MHIVIGLAICIPILLVYSIVRFAQYASGGKQSQAAGDELGEAVRGCCCCLLPLAIVAFVFIVLLGLTGGQF